MARTEKIVCDRCGAEIESCNTKTYFETKIKTTRNRVSLRGFINYIWRLNDSDIVPAREVDRRLMNTADLCKNCTTSFVRWFFMEEEKVD